MIHKILVVDDDYLIRKWLCLLLQKSTNSQAEILQAENGKKALNLLHSTKVDLVITDIKMPILNGVELIQQIRKMEWQPQIVALSSYDDYGYVRAALKEGVLDYLLKGEIELQDIDTLIEMAEREISRKDSLESSKRDEKRNEFRILGQFCEYMDDPSLDMAEFIAQIYDKKLIFPIESIAFCIFNPTRFQFSSVDILSLVRSSFKRYHIDCSVLSYRSGVFFLLYYRQTEAEGEKFSTELLRQMGNELENKIDCKIAGINQRSIYHPDQVRATFERQLSIVLRIRFYQLKQTPALLSNDQEVEFITEHKKNIFNAIQKKQHQCTKGYIETFLAQSKVYAVDPDLLINSCIAICYRLSTYVQDFISASCIPMVENSVFKLQRAQTMDEAADIMAALLETIQDLSTQYHKYSPAIEKSLDYILEHYAEKLSLEQISKYVYLNKSYFSELFKKETGINFNDYINQVRIQKACELLSGKHYNLSQIAQNVGFSDQNYFSKIFKRIIGVSPKSYQKGIRDDDK